MSSNVIALKRRPEITAGPARYYSFSGPVNLSDDFLDRAAIFQELRDCLSEAEGNPTRHKQALERITDLARRYLSTGQLG
jgi:hypothetical protein